VRQKWGKPKSLLERWSRTYQWVARARAFDNYIEKGRQITYEAEVEKMNRRDIGIAREFKGLVELRLAELGELAKRFKGIRAKNKNSVIDMGELLPPHALIRFFKDATIIERLAMGEVTERVEAAVGVEVTERLTIDQIITVLQFKEMPIDKLRLLAWGQR